MSSIVVHAPRRYALMRAHTATHLLHAELCKIFPQTKQAGSYVGEDELRFDFFADRLLDASEIEQITQQINMIIRNHHIVTVTEMSYQDAIASGAKAFFEDKYPERVRVVEVAGYELGVTSGDKTNSLSVELCGGTHVGDTGQIGGFVITEQSAVAAGVKRLVALTGPKLAEYVLALQSEKTVLADKVGVPAKQLDAKIDKLIAEHNEGQQKVQKLSAALIASKAVVSGTLGENALDLVWSYEGQGFADSVDFTEVVAYLRSTPKASTRLLYSASGQYALSHPQAKEITKNLTLKGGGSDNFIQGRDEKIVTLV